MNEPDFEEPKRVYGLDECEIAWRTPHSIFVWWELSEAGLQKAHRETPVSVGAKAVLRLFLKHPGSGAREHRDFSLTWNEGHLHLPCAIGGATVRVALGLLTEEGFFVPLTHSSVVRLPPGAPDTEVATRWAIQEVASGAVTVSEAGSQPAVLLRTVEPPYDVQSGPSVRFGQFDREQLRSNVLGGQSSQAARKDTHGGR